MPCINARAYLDDMSLELSIDGEIVKTFDLTIGDIEPSYISYFKYKPKNHNKKLKYNILFEFFKNNRLLSQPKLYIYPIYGDHVITTDPISVDIHGNLKTTED